MSLEFWKQNGWLREYKTSSEEVAIILALVDRDLADAAREEVSIDRSGSGKRKSLSLRPQR